MAGVALVGTMSLLEVWMSGRRDDRPAAPYERAARNDAVLVESFMLGYLAAEAFVRHFFAHVGVGDFGSPWWQLTDLGRRGTSFNARVASRARGDATVLTPSIDDNFLSGSRV